MKARMATNDQPRNTRKTLKKNEFHIDAQDEQNLVFEEKGLGF